MKNEEITKPKKLVKWYAYRYRDAVTAGQLWGYSGYRMMWRRDGEHCRAMERVPQFDYELEEK